MYAKSRNVSRTDDLKNNGRKNIKIAYNFNEISEINCVSL